MAVPTSIPTLFPPPSLGNRFGLHPTKVIFAPKSFFWFAVVCRQSIWFAFAEALCKELKLSRPWKGNQDLTQWCGVGFDALEFCTPICSFFYLLSFVIGVFDGVPGGPWNRELTALVHPTHLVPVQGSQHRGLLHGASTMTLPSFVFYIRHLGTFWRSQRPDFSWPSMGKAWEQRSPVAIFHWWLQAQELPWLRSAMLCPVWGYFAPPLQPIQTMCCLLLWWKEQEKVPFFAFLAVCFCSKWNVSSQSVSVRVLCAGRKGGDCLFLFDAKATRVVNGGAIPCFLLILAHLLCTAGFWGKQKPIPMLLG